MTYLLSIDPGMSTGITLGEFAPELPYERRAFWQVEGGLAGFTSWLYERYNPDDDGWWKARRFDFPFDPNPAGVAVVCEKFVPLPAPRSFKLNELEPIRIEGAVEVLLGDVVWQRAASMVLAGGATPAARKKASDDVLRRMGIWTTGKQVGMKDANDVNSAQKHAIAYLRSIGHKPTVEQLIGEET